MNKQIRVCCIIRHLNGTYEGEYKVLLEVPDNADKNIFNSSARLIEEGKDVACVLKGGNVIVVVGYKQKAGFPGFWQIGEQRDEVFVMRR